MAFRVTHVEDQVIHLIGEDNTFRDEVTILDAWEKARGGRNVNLLVEVHDDHEFVLKPFSDEVILPAHDQPIWSSKIIVSSDILKGVDATQDVWMPIKRQIKELDKAQRDLVRCENIAQKSKSEERRNRAKNEKREHKKFIRIMTEAGWDVDGLFVTFISNRSAGASLQTIDLYTNGCLREIVRDEIKAETPDQEPTLSEIESRFAYRSAAAQRCVILQLIKTLNDLTGKKPLNHRELQEVTMSFAEALDESIMDAEIAARYADKRS